MLGWSSPEREFICLEGGWWWEERRWTLRWGRWRLCVHSLVAGGLVPTFKEGIPALIP